jgi:purine nucleosidase
MEKIKVLLDTDIGTDIDDAVCLAYLLMQPRCDLLGITTVTGEAEKRGMLASALCLRAGKEIPIFAGASKPLILTQRQTHAAQATALGSWQHRTEFPAGGAIEFLRQTIRRNPGEVVLLTIAPLTNVGLLFSVDPEIPSLLRGLVMMCGRYFDPPPVGYGPVEWNAVVDAHATSIVYGSSVAMHRSVGLDVTSRASMGPEDFRTTFGNIPLFAPVLDWAEIWFNEWPETTFHDPLAAATLFDSDLCTFDKGTVTVDLTDGPSLGMTQWKAATEPSRHEVATTVDVDRFFQHVLSVVQGESRD